MPSNIVVLPIAPRVQWNGCDINRTIGKEEVRYCSARVVHLTYLGLNGEEPRCHITFQDDKGMKEHRWVASETLSVVGDPMENSKTWHSEPLCV